MAGAGKQGLAPGEVVSRDFSALQQQSSDQVPSMGVLYPHGLTPQEKNLYQHHMNNLTHGGFVQQGESVSTIFNATAEIDGKHYVIPTVWEGKILSPGEAIDRAKNVGLDKFPSYPSRQEAEDRYLNELHPLMEQDVKPLMQILSYLKSKGMM